MIKQFSFTGAKKMVFGNGIFDTLAEHLGEMKVSRPLIVLDKNLSQTGLKDRVSGLLNKGGCKPTLFDSVEAEPRLEMADKGADIAIKEKSDGVIGIGGGSAMDVAKAISVITTNRGRAADYLGLNKVPVPGLPKIMVPTTAGTGSEVTFTAVFIRKNLKKKEGMNSPYLYPELALLDPQLTLSLPSDPTATTGIDALCHAIESFTSINASPYSEMVSLEAIQLIAANLRTCVHSGGDLIAREKMLLGSFYAGLGLANAGVTAVHSLSYPLGGQYGVAHGLANTILLPAVMMFNLPGALEKFAIIAEAMGERIEDISLREAAYLAVEAVESLVEDCCIYDSLSSLNIKEEEFPVLADVAMTVTRPLDNNPRKITKEDAVEIYKRAL